MKKFLKTKSKYFVAMSSWTRIQNKQIFIFYNVVHNINAQLCHNAMPQWRDYAVIGTYTHTHTSTYIQSLHSAGEMWFLIPSCAALCLPRLQRVAMKFIRATLRVTIIKQRVLLTDFLLGLLLLKTYYNY